MFSSLGYADVLDSFLILANNMPNHDKMPELLSYFEHAYIRSGRQPGRGGRGEHYGSAMFHIET